MARSPFLWLVTLCLLVLISPPRPCHASISISEEKDMNALIFTAQYLHKQPLIIESSTASWCVNPSFFDVKNLYSTHGDDVLQMGDSMELAQMHRHKVDSVPLKTYLLKKKYKHYQIFDPYFIANNAHEIGLQSSQMLHSLHPSPLNLYTFLMGKIGSGMSFQSHGSVWWHQVVGATRIYVYPPAYAPIGGALDFSGYTSLQWTDYILPHLSENIMDVSDDPPQKEINDKHLKDVVYDTNITSVADIFDMDKQPLFVPYRPLECVVTEGQLLYIPRLWWYSTLNIANAQNVSIAMLMQTETLPKEAALERRYYNDALRTFKTGYEYLYRFDDAKGSQHYFEKTILVDPTLVSAYVALIDIYIQASQQVPQYMRHVERFMKIVYLLNPDYEVVQKGLSNLLRQKGDVEAADRVDKKLPLSLE